MRWLFNNSQVLLPVIFVIFSVIWQMIKAGVERKQQMDAQRTGARPMVPGDSTGAMLKPSEVSVQNRPPAATQNELAAQRQAQIEMWRAQQAALGGKMQSPSAAGGRSAEDDLANRRRQAMEELRRRQIQVDQMRSRQPTNQPQPMAAAPASRRQAAKNEAQRRQVAQQRRNAAPVARPVATTRSSIIGEVVAAAAAPPEHPPRVIPASRTTPAGSLVFGPESLRQAFVMKELLDPPLALRDNSAGFGAGYDQSV